MLYLYRCKCGKTVEIIKPHQESGRTEYCECGNMLQRIYTVPGLKISPNGSDWNYGMGCLNKNVSDKISQKADSGQSFGIPVGTEKPKECIRHNNYQMSGKEMHEIGQIIGDPD
jgi:predicted nucleic acid-binding Zn ribbon protein